MKLNELFDVSGKSLTLKDVKNTEGLAKKLHTSVEELKKYSNQELLTILQNIGYHDFEDNNQFDKKELELGIKIEREHTNSDLVARLIALDHLSEPGMEHYYSALKNMEKNEKEKKSFD
jgi:hypothetical protein